MFFVLTYYLDAESMADDCRDMTMLKKYDNNVSSLKILARGIDYLIMFLRDPGGSGKSEVIKQVLLYSQKFCKNLNVKFNNQAAALQNNGETLDSNAGMMAKNRRDSCNRFSADMMAAWKETRILVVDEVSFISCEKLERLDRNLKN